MNKEILIDALREIAFLEEHSFKSRAYLQAVMILSEMSDEEFNERRTFLNIPGIGLSINTKIMDYKIKGILPAKLFNLRESNKAYLDVQRYKVRKSFVTKRVLRSEAARWIELLKEELSKVIPIESVLFLGSYRREKYLIADLDVVIIGRENYIKATEHLNQVEDMVTRINGGGQKSSYKFNTPDNLALDINWCEPEHLPFAMLHYTGSAASNIRLRARAKELGYTLNQYGLTPNNPTVNKAENINTEEDIFTFLGMQYVQPKNR